MANLKEIRTRISSVSSTRQITSAMKMVAAAKLRKAQDTIIQLRPYADELEEILNSLMGNVQLESDYPFIQKRKEKKVLIILVSSNKGLCGGFNTNIAKKGIELAKSKYAHQFKKNQVDFYTIGE